MHDEDSSIALCLVRPDTLTSNVGVGTHMSIANTNQYKVIRTHEVLADSCIALILTLLQRFINHLLTYLSYENWYSSNGYMHESYLQSRAAAAQCCHQ